MQWPRGGRAALGIAAAAVAIGAVAALLQRGSDYEVAAIAVTAGRLVEGSPVKVSGRQVGTVSGIRLTADARAKLTLSISDGHFVPLHAGTTAIVRSPSLTNVAGRYVALEPGPNNAPSIPTGGDLGVAVEAQVDLDQIIDTLDTQTRAAVRNVIRGSAAQYDGVEGEASVALRRLAPALGSLARTGGQLNSQDEALASSIRDLAIVAASTARRSAAIRGIVDHGQAVTAALANRRANLAQALTRTPALLGTATQAFSALTPALGELSETLDLAGPVAPRLARLLRQLDALTARTPGALEAVRVLLPDLARALNGLPRLSLRGLPAARATTSLLNRSAPIVAASRAYTPDLLSGYVNGFGGMTAGYYDANGHYARIAITLPPAPLNDAGSAADDGASRAAGWRLRQTARCPGAAAEPAADGSNPYMPRDAPCRKDERG